jgi:hypothetical protein
VGIDSVVSWIQAGLWVIALFVYFGRLITGRASMPKLMPTWVKRASSSNLLIGIVILGGLVVSAYSVFTMASKPRIVVMKSFIDSYGLAEQNLYAAIDTDQLLDRRKMSHVFVVFRIADYTLDERYDATIEKSNVFDISGGYLLIEHPLSQAFKARLGRSHGGYMRIYLVILPKDIQPEKITLLSDVEALNGQILDEKGFSVNASVVLPMGPTTGVTKQPLEQ